MSLRRFQASLVLAVSLASLSATAEEPADQETAGAAAATDTPDSTDEAPPPKPRGAKLPAAKPPADVEPPTAQPAADATADVKPPQPPAGWRTEVSGYFRAPMALGISSRPGPDNPTGPASTQVSYGPNRTVDANYYSFAYTRLQEQDWAEVFVHAKKKHVDAAVGWMGYWLQSVGFRNYDAAWAPGLAYVRLDTDFGSSPDLPSNIAFTAGAWWPSFGYFEKYDTYTLGRFRQLGEQLKLTLPIDHDFTATLTEGFGTNRDGSFNPGAPAFYGAIVGIDLITYFNAQLTYRNNLDVSFHYNTEWTADPNLTMQSMPDPKSYEQAQLAHLTVVGGEIHLRAPFWGHLWISPSYINVRNGWALASGGTEVMHSLSGAGIATNYMAWTGSPSDSTGTGTMFNLGFLYENSLSDILGYAPGTLPDLSGSVFGLLADSSLNLPATTTLLSFDPNVRHIEQLKLGADATVQALTWLGFMLRFDIVNYDLERPGLIFESITARTIFASHFLSSERIYLQYSRYRYGDKMVLNGSWPWGAPLVAGANVLQQGPYSGMTPDENVVKLQADIAF